MFTSTIWPGSSCSEFACSPHVYVDSLWEVWLSPTVQRLCLCWPCDKLVTCPGFTQTCGFNILHTKCFAVWREIRNGIGKTAVLATADHNKKRFSHANRLCSLSQLSLMFLSLSASSLLTVAPDICT